MGLDTLDSVIVPLVEELCLDPAEEIKMSVAGILEPVGKIHDVIRFTAQIS